MLIKDVVSVTQAGLNSLIGAGYFPVDKDADPSAYALQAQDSALLVEMGEVAKSMTVAADLVFNTLIDVIGKMIVDTREYTPSLPKLFVDPIEWGGFVEHVHAGLSDVMVDEMWDTAYEGGTYGTLIDYRDTATVGGTTKYIGKEYAQHIAGIEHGVYKPKVHAKIYKEAKNIMIALTTAREQLFTAFQSWDEMNKLLSALKTSVQNTINLKAEIYALMTVSSGIGRAYALNHCLNLRAMYNTENGFTSTDAGYLASANACLNSEKFMAYALSVIADTRDNMQRFSVAFNNGAEPMFTPADDNNLILLSKFVNKAKFGVRANTYNEQLLGIGKYDRVTAWQGISDGTNNFGFDTLSTISLSADSSEKLGIASTATAIPNIIGFMYDRYAMGITLDKRKTTTSYTGANDSWNTFNHFLVNYIINDDYNMVAFGLGEDDE